MKLIKSVKLPGTMAALALALTGWAGNALAIPTTTGFTFDLPAGTTLSNVYVIVATAPNAAEFNDFLMPAGTTAPGFTNISPAGFSVPSGSSGMNLGLVEGNPGTDGYFAVVGELQSGGSTDIFYGTNLNLAGQNNPADCPGGCTEATYEGWLESGLIGVGEGTGIGLSMAQGLLEQSGFAALGSTVDLYQFSNGSLVAGASVTSNVFGTPNGGGGGTSTPEPATVLLLATGLAGLAAARREKARKRKQASPETA